MGFQLKTTLLKIKQEFQWKQVLSLTLNIIIENDCIYVHKFDTEYRK